MQKIAFGIVLSLATTSAYATPVYINAGVVMKNGDVKPAALAQLTANPVCHSICFADASVKLGSAASFTEITDLANAFFKERVAKSANKPISFSTDLKGNATVDLKPGDWFIYGRHNLGMSTIQWDKYIKVGRSPQKLELSNANAVHIGDRE